MKIFMLETVRPEFVFLLSGVPKDTILVYGEVYDVTQNKHGAVCGICKNGKKLLEDVDKKYSFVVLFYYWIQRPLFFSFLWGGCATA